MSLLDAPNCRTDSHESSTVQRAVTAGSGSRPAARPKTPCCTTFSRAAAAPLFRENRDLRERSGDSKTNLLLP